MKAAIICIIGLLGSWGHAAAEPLVEGRVRLPSGQPVPGVQVLLFDLADLRAAPLAATTDRSGHFTLPLTPLGAALPEGFELGANYPNPFNPSTMIPYQLPAAMHVRLQVFNLLGQRVATLVDGEQPAGFHTASWDATDAAGQAVGAGVYLYRLSGDGVQATRSMLLIDGQAGMPSGGGGSTGLEGEADTEEGVESAPVYGLTISGPGLVPYVDPAFRVETGMVPLEVVVEAPGSLPSAKVASGGLLGDVDNTGDVDFFDALLVALYSQDSSIVMPNNGDISLGDVNADGRVGLADAWLIAAYLNDPSDPSLPAGIGEPVGPAASLSPDPSTVTFADDGAWHRFTVEAGEPVTVVANPGTTPRLEITTRSGRGNYCPAEADDDVSRQDGQVVYLAGCATGTATVELRRPSDGTVLNTYTFEVTGSPADLVVESASVSDSTLTPGQSFTLRATVRNQGTGQSAATTLRYYRSSNRTISTGDTQVGTDPVGALGGSRTSPESISLTAPSSEGTYYYGACVVSVSGESNTRNNCSTGIRVTVEARSPDLVVESSSVSDSSPTPGQSFTLRATVRNQGSGRSAATTLRYYRSTNATNATISTRDTQVGTDPVGTLAAAGTSAESISLTAPSSEGTWYYGACVVSVSGESDTRNNCSSSVRVTVAPAPASQAWKLYWTDWGAGKIQRSNLDGSNVEDLVTTGLDYPDRIALDVSGGKMYWTDWGTEKIQRSNLDGSGVEDLVTTGLAGPDGLALDVSGGKMYWTDWGTDKIQRSNLDGSGVEDLVTGLESPVGIALDVSGGKMYWADAGTDKIQRSNLDGSGVEDLVTTGLAGPDGLALDVSGGKMYWTDNGTDKIQRSNLDGSGVEDLVTGLDGPLGIALDMSSGKIYWTDIGTKRSSAPTSTAAALKTSSQDWKVQWASRWVLCPSMPGRIWPLGYRSAQAACCWDSRSPCR